MKIFHRYFLNSKAGKQLNLYVINVQQVYDDDDHNR